uniref:Uncharacterized protein n=1 Tax=Rousettus aegyptiacus TaxID=9407 RepID=A0A7J8D6Y3_ROUAE|nr:hypothetical protein HJG63_008886 [Rousettus aegyptiacus]
MRKGSAVAARNTCLQHREGARQSPQRPQLAPVRADTSFPLAQLSPTPNLPTNLRAICFLPRPQTDTSCQASAGCVCTKFTCVPATPSEGGRSWASACFLRMPGGPSKLSEPSARPSLVGLRLLKWKQRE